ncbi:hypothetical protein [Actinoplanes sp. NPDC051851]|uniref:YncE family protein n=1 Tax=Actinoplanes sp. NPDC051851 TaxID=3154753 RepID=UPI0034222A35
MAPAAALADSSRTLSIKSVGDMIVDGVHKLVFVSDPTGNKVVATTYDGTPVASQIVADPTNLALSADSGQLYVASPDGLAIVALDTATLAQTAKYSVGSQVYDVAVAAGKIWFTSGSSLGVIDPAAETPAPVLTKMDDWSGSTELAAGSADSNRLGAAGYGYVSILDVSDGTPQVVGYSSADSASVADMAISPAGDRIATVTPGDYVVTVRDVENLSAVTRLAIEAYPEAVDIATDGTIVGGSFSWYDPDLHVFTAAGELVRQYDIPNTGNSSGADELQRRGVAWEPDGSRLFAVSVNTYGTYSLRTYTEPKKSLPALTLSGPSSATRAKSLTVSGTLTASVGLPAGTALSVTRTDLESPSGKALGTVTTSASGKFSFADTPPAGGTVKYRVSYAGDGSHAAVAATKSIAVSRAATTLTLTNNGKIYKYGTTASFTAHLGSTYKSRTVEIWIDPYGSDQGKRLLKRAVVNSKGNVSAGVKLTRNAAVTATFTGDARTAPKTVKSVVYTTVNVSLKLSKYYKTAKIGSTKYRYYHKKTTAKFTAKVTAHSGRKAYFQVQIYYQGKWRNWGDAYATTSNGSAAVVLDGSGVAGYRMRVRAAYRKGGSGDSLNYTTYTAYSYLIFK